ncbi:transposase [Patescibacteria group bacterium]|nr:transposase [Patescibacteria group bacterium]
MGRSKRVDIGNYVYHIINRANARLPIFFEEKDYLLFEEILREGVKKYEMRLLSYCLMPNHFHLVLYPKLEGDIQKFMQWVTLTHTQRWHSQNKTTGTGHLYQGRYKSFIIQTDNHIYTVIRYVERNALRAKLVKKAENWRFSSLFWRFKNKTNSFLSDWPISEPKDYLDFVNTPITNTELDEIRESVHKGKPYGKNSWVDTKIKEFNLQATIRSRGRPKKGT